MYEYIGILLGARPVLHISRIMVKEVLSTSPLKMVLKMGPKHVGASF
jgi:hypothetical protein